MTEIQTLRRDLAAAFVLADRFGLSEGICNHFSAVVPGRDERFLINPYGLHWSEMKPDSLLLIDGQGTVLEGEGEVEATARTIHIAGHRANPRHKVLLHTHMPHATALTMLEGGKLEMAHQTAVRFWRRMAHHAFGGIALDDAEGERIAEAQKDNPDADIFFLDNHGVTVGGESVAAAFDDLYYLERACRQQILAQSTGLPFKIISDDMLLDTHRQLEQVRIPQAESFYTALLRCHALG
ncbi:aldolase [Rhodospirillaceae bacterium KN72]|uniref:Aldolase n=1 Tax=Pacificispira spongiicola TaxID=2729598 RepID=A0A7Y0HI28_9PROT|nr:aldolase [Pacificispira spongiicola]NMM46074.1 aldolase [Pacificispira spongiicola]